MNILYSHDCMYEFGLFFHYHLVKNMFCYYWAVSMRCLTLFLSFPNFVVVIDSCMTHSQHSPLSLTPLTWRKTQTLTLTVLNICKTIMMVTWSVCLFNSAVIIWFPWVKCWIQPQNYLTITNNAVHFVIEAKNWAWFLVSFSTYFLT